MAAASVSGCFERYSDQIRFLEWLVGLYTTPKPRGEGGGGAGMDYGITGSERGLRTRQHSCSPAALWCRALMCEAMAICTCGTCNAQTRELQVDYLGDMHDSGRRFLTAACGL